MYIQVICPFNAEYESKNTEHATHCNHDLDKNFSFEAWGDKSSLFAGERYFCEKRSSILIKYLYLCTYGKGNTVRMETEVGVRWLHLHMWIEKYFLIVLIMVSSMYVHNIVE
jgi:hypothetical protein